MVRQLRENSRRIVTPTHGAGNSEAKVGRPDDGDDHPGSSPKGLPRQRFSPIAKTCLSCPWPIALTGSRVTVCHGRPPAQKNLGTITVPRPRVNAHAPSTIADYHTLTAVRFGAPRSDRILCRRLRPSCCLRSPRSRNRLIGAHVIGTCRRPGYAIDVVCHGRQNDAGIYRRA